MRETVRGKLIYNPRYGEYELVFTDEEYEVYSFREGDEVFSWMWAELDAMPAWLQEKARSAEGRLTYDLDKHGFSIPDGVGVEVEVPFDEITKGMCSVISKRDRKPVAFAAQDLIHIWFVGVGPHQIRDDMRECERGRYAPQNYPKGGGK